MTPRRIGSVPELDSIRGTAMVVVFLAHLWIVWPTWTFHEVFADGGFVGVDLFFVLSGFLITALLLGEQAATGAIRYGAFLWRRALRLLPALWFLLVAHALYAAANDYPPFGNASYEWRALRAAATFTMNWEALWHPFVAGEISPIWSLSIEAQFYVVWPAVVLLCLGLRRPTAAVLATMVPLIVGVTVWRAVLFDTHGWEAAYLRSDSHVDGLLVGSLAACAWVRGWTPRHLPRWALWAAWAVFGAVLLNIRADQAWAYRGGTSLVLAASTVIVLVAVTTARQEQGPLGRVTAAIGRLSYGIYLWHFPVFFAATRWGWGWSNVERTASAVAVIAVAVAASRLLVELPALRLKERRPRQPPARPDPPTWPGGPPPDLPPARPGGPPPEGPPLWQPAVRSPDGGPAPPPPGSPGGR